MYTALSTRSRDIAPFHVMALLARAQALEAAGHDVIHLEIGEPDFTTASPVIAAGQAALAAGQTRYTTALGLPALRQAIAGFYAERYGVMVDPSRVVVTPGGSGALLLAASALVNPDQHWLLADPGYPCNRHFLRLVEASARLVPVTAADNWQLTPEHIDRHWSPQTAGALVASPANPTGSVLTREALQSLAETVRGRQGNLVVDEIYHGLTYGLDAASVLEVAPDAWVLNSFSKYFGMTGWRLGWLIAPSHAIPALEKLAQNLYISAPTVAQHAALACFTPEAIAEFEARRAEFGRRRDALLPVLRRIGLGIERVPEGAFYLYCDVSAFTDDAQTLCHYLLETEHVALTPGVDFGQHGASTHLRIAYTQPIPRLLEAAARIERGLQRWQQRGSPIRDSHR